MNDDGIEEILEAIGAEEVPADIQGIARKATSEFSESLKVSGPDLSEDHALECAIAGLAENHREVLLLRYRDGYSWSKIARLLGISSETITKTLSQAYVVLHDSLRSTGQAQAKENRQ